jgi:hypothetical protein
MVLADLSLINMVVIKHKRQVKSITQDVIDKHKRGHHV